MGPVEIAVIVIVVAIVVAVIASAAVRKLKGKPSLSSDCCGCPYHGDCKGACRSQDDDVMAELREQYAKRSLDDKKDDIIS